MAKTEGIPWGKLTPAEHGSITQGILRADHTFRYMTPEDAKEAGRRHRELIALMLAGISAAEPDIPRAMPDALSVAVANNTAHSHDDLPLGPASELGSDDPSGLIERSEAETYRLAAIGRVTFGSSKAKRSKL